jgi:WD40 repeat protein
MKIKTGKKFKIMKHESLVNSVVFSDDSNLIFTGSFDRIVRVYNRKTKEISILKKHNELVNTVAIS